MIPDVVEMIMKILDHRYDLGVKGQGKYTKNLYAWLLSRTSLTFYVDGTNIIFNGYLKPDSWYDL